MARGAASGWSPGSSRPTACQAGRPRGDDDKGRTVAEFRELAELTRAGGLTMQQIEIRFHRDKKEWKHEIAIETAENHKRLYRARKSLDGEVAAALAAFADSRPGWE